jgi:hypothetical protein
MGMLLCRARTAGIGPRCNSLNLNLNLNLRTATSRQLSDTERKWAGPVRPTGDLQRRQSS